jgi:hypothetical protein
MNNKPSLNGNIDYPDHDASGNPFQFKTLLDGVSFDDLSEFLTQHLSEQKTDCRQPIGLWEELHDMELEGNIRYTLDSYDGMERDETIHAHRSLFAR